jgi:hypothetical protein
MYGLHTYPAFHVCVIDKTGKDKGVSGSYVADLVWRNLRGGTEDKL